MRIVFSGMIAADPWQGGATWAVLQYVLGLSRLGHDVYFVEPIKPEKIQPACSGLDESANAEYFRLITGQFEFQSRSALLLAGTRQTVGLSYDDLHDQLRDADLLFNVSGMLGDSELIARIPTRVYLDWDPAFVQLWHATQGIDMRLDAHTHFATVGLSIGQTGCDVPTCGREWIQTLQPVVLEQWPVSHAIVNDALTTVGNWRGYGSIHHNGQHFGQRAHSFRAFIDLPLRTAQALLPALAIHPQEKPDVAALSTIGWKLADPAVVARDPATYRRFIQGSRGELSIAKSGYVVSRCGWFSDRSACYLASGRPVIAQETGFSRHLPTGQGLLAFETMEELVRAIDEMNQDYAAHARAARRIAEAHFDSDRVLARLMEQTVGVAA